MAGTLEFAVSALNVPDVVVCGHSHCGVVQGLVSRESGRTMPLLERWLARADDRPGPARVPRTAREAGGGPETAAQRHVLAPLDHLRDYPCVAQRLARGLRLHAWFYVVEIGQVLTHRPGLREFLPL